MLLLWGGLKAFDSFSAVLAHSFTVSYLIFDLTLNVPMRLPRKFLICSHLLGCAFSDQHDHRPFCKVVDVGREREAISQDFEASPGMIARLHKFYNKSHDQYLRRTRSTWSCKGTMLCRTLQLATFAQSVATQFAEGALFNENFYKCKYVLSGPWEGRPCYDHPTADGLRGPVWCRDEEAGNQILVPHQHSCWKRGRADFGSESQSSPDQSRVS